MLREVLKAEVIKWIAVKLPLIDTAIAKASRDHYQALQSLPNFNYDVRCSLDEAYGLSEGEDLCYDRPTTALMYDLWYKPQRISTCIPIALEALIDAERDLKVEVFDLGAGTGAFQCAIALVAAALHDIDRGRKFNLHFVNIDSSAIMLNHLDQQWEALLVLLPEIDELEITYDCSLNSYTKSARISTARSWVCCSYLFDHSDKVDQIIQDFDALIANFSPSKILVGASRYKFNNVASKLKSKLLEREYAYNEVDQQYICSSPTTEINSVRAEIYNQVNDQRLLRYTQWRSTASKGAVLLHQSSTLNLAAAPKHVNIEMFLPKLPERTKISLTPEQEVLCKPSKQPIAIFGPAGSGKSVILSEHLRRAVEAVDYDANMRVLVATFNKRLVTEVLAEWMGKLLDSERIYYGNASDGHASISFKTRSGSNSGSANIQLFNFDKLPTRIGKVHKVGAGSGRVLFGSNQNNKLTYETEYLNYIQASIDDVKSRLDEFQTNYDSVSHVLEVSVVQDEFERIVYGKDALSAKDYFVKGDLRRGRMPILPYDKTPRKVLWAVLECFIRKCDRDQIEGFLSRRIRFRRQIDALQHQNLYTHIYIDELQDCTDADFGIFYGLLVDPNNLFVTGDLAQAVHLGRSSKSALPRHDHFYNEQNGHSAQTLKDQSNWSYKTLEGSFRLPFRISEALIPLSKTIQTQRSETSCDDNSDVSVVLQHPYKGSPPGIRPIVVSASTEIEIARKVAAIKLSYGKCGAGRLGMAIHDDLIVMEHDQPLVRALKNVGVNATSDSILRVKGLEFAWVLWSCRASFPSDDDCLEYTYTILTRTSGMAIIAILGSPSNATKRVLSTLRYERIICWDEVSKATFLDAQVKENHDVTQVA